ncbi:MAG: DUF456 domain-containing protein [Bacteroidales bacterium]|nr:DUF456 domain-containing protein [Bacteroidales bacterium]
MLSLVAVLAVLAGIIGIIGSIVPGLPGPPVSWVGLLLLYVWGSGADTSGDPMTLSFLIIWFVIMLVVTVIDYVVPASFTKLTGGTKAAGRGAIAGLIVGLFVPPVGIILGTLLGAFLSELIFARKDGWQSAKSAMGALLGFLFGTGIKLVASGLMMYYIFVYMN